MNTGEICYNLLEIGQEPKEKNFGNKDLLFFANYCFKYSNFMQLQDIYCSVLDNSIQIMIILPVKLLLFDLWDYIRLGL